MHASRFVGFTAVVAALVLYPPCALATEPDAFIGGAGCATIPQGADGVHRQSFDAAEPSGELAGTPARIVTDIQRGDSGKLCVGFQNRTDGPVNLDLSVADVGIDAQGLPASGASDAEFGAAGWMTLSAQQIDQLAPGDMAWIEVDVAVPGDAVTGSSYGSIIAQQRVDDSGPKDGVKVQSAPSIAVQVFFDVPGNADFDGRLVDARSPRVIWWDGLEFGELPVLDRLRGLGVAAMRMGWRNDGNLTDDVRGRVVITSDLTGRTVATLKLEPRSVLRGSTRKIEATWANDIPMFGRFTPTVEITAGGGKVSKVELDPIWVIPSWWYLLALAIALAIPLALRRRSKRRYRALEERVAAAEAGVSADNGDDAWDDEDAWDSTS